MSSVHVEEQNLKTYYYIETYKEKIKMLVTLATGYQTNTASYRQPALVQDTTCEDVYSHNKVRQRQTFEIDSKAPAWGHRNPLDVGIIIIRRTEAFASSETAPPT